ncbi:zf-HC2 domain-containing protein [Bacillus altitudinis]|uniref:zf-HC2 domain-containing protein n=1 Tax=Bacillus altitudinis TaxID=293387 RepID=UPI00345A2439
MSCYLIEELLPLYIEGDTSKETNQLVDEHLRSCKKCRYLYEEMKESVSIAKSTDFIPFIDEKEEKRKFERRYYGKLLLRASIVFSIVYLIMLLIYWI